MTSALRDGQTTVVHVDEDVIRASVGLGELFARPTVTLKACYGVPQAGPSRKPVDISLQDGESKSNSVNDTNPEDQEGRRSWLVGEALEKALAEPDWAESLELRWPFRQTKGHDWDGREFIISDLLNTLNIGIANNKSPLLLVPPPSPPSLPLSTQALYAPFAFERLNVPAFSILPSPLAALYALGATTGIVLHISRHTSEVSIVIDSVVRWESCISVQVGQEDCEIWFENLLMGDDSLDRALREASGVVESWMAGQKERLVKEMAEVVWRDCTGDDIEVPIARVGSKAFVVANSVNQEDEGAFDVAKKLVGDAAPAPSAASHKSKKQQSALAVRAAADAAAVQAASDAAAQADFISLTIPSLLEKEIPLGPVRHRLLEPLLVGKGVGRESVWEGMGRAVESSPLSYVERIAIWEGIGVVGEAARIKCFPPALMTYLAPFLLSSPDLPSDTQPAKVRLLSIPEYFANYKNATSELAPFLGGSMVAKVAFSDAIGKHCITKVDYNAKGPAAIYAVSAGDDRYS